MSDQKEEVSLVNTSSRGLTLTPSTDLTAEQFERAWLNLGVGCQQAVPWQKTVQPDTIQAALQVVRIQTIAMSKAGSQLWKAYLGAQDDTGCVFLTELQFDPGNAEMQMLVKQSEDKPEALQAFLLVLKTVLGTVVELTS